MKLLWIAPALMLAACASTEAGVSATASADAQSSATSIDGLTIRFFQCSNNEAFTVQNYQNGSLRVTTRGNTYDLQGSGDTYTASGVTYVRSADTATLTGADGTYAGCTTTR